MKNSNPKSRFKPLSEGNRLVGVHLGYLRRLEKVKQSDFASAIGITRDMLSNIESGRVALKLGTGWKVAQDWDITPYFFFTGSQKPFPELHPKMRVFLDKYCVTHADSSFGDAWPVVGQMVNLNLQQQEALAEKLVGLTHETTISAAVVDHIFEKGENEGLTDTSTSANLADVKDQWPGLKKRIQKFATDAKSRVELMKALGVSDKTRISQWLTDSKNAREPGAEYALRMLHWVEQQERQK